MNPEVLAELERRRDSLTVTQQGALDELIRRQGASANQPSGVENADTRGNIGQQFLQGAAFNAGDEAMGSIANMYAGFINMLDPNGVSGITGKNMYDDINQRTATQSVRDDLKAFETRNPKTALAAQIAGGLTSGGSGGAKVLGSQAIKNAPRVIQALAIPAVAGAEGAAFGFGEGENMEERITKAGQQGATSAILGPLMAWGGNKIANKYLKKTAKDIQDAVTPTQSIKGLHDEAQSFYRAAERMDITINYKPYNEFRNKLVDLIDNEGVKGNVKTQISKSLNQLKALKNPTYRDLEKAKQMLTSAKRSSDNAVQEAAETISRGIDEFVDGLRPSMVSGRQGTNVNELGENLNTARDLWHRKAQAETIETMQEHARINNAVSGEGDIDKAMRSQIGSTLKSDKKLRGLDKEVVTELDDILMGGTAKGIVRSTGSASPGAATARGPLAALSAGGLGVLATGGNPVGAFASLIPAAAGKIGTYAAGKNTTKQMEKLKNAIVNRGQLKIDDIVSHLKDQPGQGFGSAPSLRGMIDGGSAGVASTYAANQEGIDEYAGVSMTELQRMLKELTESMSSE